LLILAVLAVPTFSLFQNPSLWVDGWSMMNLADWLVFLLAMSLCLVALEGLRRVGADPLAPFRSRPRTLGILFALAVLFGPFDRFLYLPVPMLVGTILLTCWLLPDYRGRVPARLASAIQSPSRGELLKEVVEGGRKLQQAKEERRTDQKAEQAEQPGGGDGRPAAITVEQTRTLRERQSVVLSLGPSALPWENGKVFAGYSLWISSGWLLLYYVPHEMSLWLQNGRYLTLGALTVIVWNAVQWPALGFLMGYFYPAIRGTNGLWKGLSVALTYITPWLVQNLAFQSVNEQGTWQPFVVWALQVFVTAVLTGFLAGELRTLQQQGYGGGDVTYLHNFSALAAWGSSVVVAIIGAVVALLTTTLGQVVTNQFAGGPKTPGTP
jgi:hypothetical protein